MRRWSFTLLLLCLLAAVALSLPPDGPNSSVGAPATDGPGKADDGAEDDYYTPEDVEEHEEEEMVDGDDEQWDAAHAVEEDGPYEETEEVVVEHEQDETEFVDDGEEGDEEGIGDEALAEEQEEEEEEVDDEVYEDEVDEEDVEVEQEDDIQESDADEEDDGGVVETEEAVGEVKVQVQKRRFAKRKALLWSYRVLKSGLGKGFALARSASIKSRSRSASIKSAPKVKPKPPTSKNATTSTSVTRAKRLMRVIPTRLPAKAIARHSIQAAALLLVLLLLRGSINVTNVMQLLAVVGMLVELAMRLGVFRMRAVSGPTNVLTSSTFSFEYLNDRYERDRDDLSFMLAKKAAYNGKVQPIAAGSSLLASSTASWAVLDAMKTAAYGAKPPLQATTNASVPTTPVAGTPSAAGDVPGSAASAQDLLQQRSLRPRCFVANIHGDLMLTQGAYLTKLVNFILSSARPSDEVVLTLESAGGVVQEYGHGAAQLDRIRRAGILLTVCVDKVAASGGYMLACVADRVVAAPFAMIGSIGVTTSAPVMNINKLLGRWGVQAYSVRAGKHKAASRVLVGDAKEDQETLSRVQEDLKRVHDSFKTWVGKYRPMADPELVGTGQVWQGESAKVMGMVDEIATAEDYISTRLPTHDVIQIKPAPERKRWSLLRPEGAPVPAVSTLGGAGRWSVKGMAKRLIRGGFELVLETVVELVGEGSGGPRDLAVHTHVPVAAHRCI